MGIERLGEYKLLALIMHMPINENVEEMESEGHDIAGTQTV